MNKEFADAAMALAHAVAEVRGNQIRINDLRSHLAMAEKNTTLYERKVTEALALLNEVQP